MPTETLYTHHSSGFEHPLYTQSRESHGHNPVLLKMVCKSPWQFRYYFIKYLSYDKQITLKKTHNQPPVWTAFFFF